MHIALPNPPVRNLLRDGQMRRKYSENLQLEDRKRGRYRYGYRRDDRLESPDGLSKGVSSQPHAHHDVADQ